MNTEVRIYNKSLELQGIVDEYSSLIWIRRYQMPGEFELRTPYTPESKAIIKPGYIVQKYDGRAPSEAGVIEYLYMTEDEIIAKGRFLESYLDRRLIKETSYYSGKVETSLRRIITEMAAIPLLSLGESAELTETLRFQATYKPVLSIIEKACKSTALGFRIRPDFANRALYFEVYKGVDRTAEDSEKVIFSEKYDNLLNESYTYEDTNLKTKAYAVQTINDVRTVYEVGGGTGLDLREVLVSTSVDTQDQSTADIRASMITQAERALDARTINESFTFATDAESPFTYRVDYDIGDQVLVKHSAWGIELELRISEIEEDYENGGREIVLTCGSTMPEIMDFEEG